MGPHEQEIRSIPRPIRGDAVIQRPNTHPTAEGVAEVDVEAVNLVISALGGQEGDLAFEQLLIDAGMGHVPRLTKLPNIDRKDRRHH